MQVPGVDFFSPLDTCWIRLLYCTIIFVLALLSLFLCLSLAYITRLLDMFHGCLKQPDSSSWHETTHTLEEKYSNGVIFGAAVAP